MHDYQQYVDRLLALQRDARLSPLGAAPLPPPPAPRPAAPHAVLLSPHPDDECIFGGLPLRLMRESGWRVTNIAVTQGSNKARQPERLAELRNACRYLGFEVAVTVENGLENINPKSRGARPETWQRAVARIAELLATLKPDLLFAPHEREANTTHQGVALLARDALESLGATLPVRLAETEFWSPIETPNLLVEIPPDLLAELMTALSFHIGEVRRNPYHLTLPAWMMDNVRRGGEVVGAQGGAAPDFPFAALYRLRRWDGRCLADDPPARRILTAGEPAAAALA